MIFRFWSQKKNLAYLFFSAFILLIVFKPWLNEGLIRPPDFLVWRFADFINEFFNFLKDDLGVTEITRFFSSIIEKLIDLSANLLYGKRRWPYLPALPWTVVMITAFMIGYSLNGWRLGILCGGTFLWIALMGQWKWSMETISVIMISAPFSILFGLVFGIIAWKKKWFENLIIPFINIAQSLPHFSYMIPVVIFIGVGPKAGAIVTIIFATPPMIRMVILGLKKVPGEVIESGKMCGANKWQLLFKVQLPTARTDILIGVNQVIMQSLAMVVLASFIGMPGLGQKLLQLLQSLKIGRSIEIGITIVLIAIILDRCTKAWINTKPVHFEKDTLWWVRHRRLLTWMLLTIFCFILPNFFPLAYKIDRGSALTFSKQLDAVVDVVIVLIDPITYALRSFLIQWILIPIRDSFLWLPYTAVLFLVTGVGWWIGKLKSAMVCLMYIGLIAMSSWWDRAMITSYMVSFAVVVSICIGFPTGILASRNKKSARFVLFLCDTAQTFPSFIYLIPVIMLFGVNDVAAIGSVITFGTVPIIRYTIEGIQNVPIRFIEAAEMCGASQIQKTWKVKIPISLPVIMVGVNQCVLFSLFMVIIAAFIGTQDLGQEMQRALSATDVGKGMVLGLCVAFMGLMIDHLINKWSKRKKDELGIN